MGYFFGALVLMALIGIYKVKGFQETFRIYVDGMKGMTDVAVTLVLAWCRRQSFFSGRLCPFLQAAPGEPLPL